MLTHDANKIVDTVDFGDDTLKEHSAMIMTVFKQNMVDKGISKIEIRNGDNEPVENGVHSYVSEDTFKNILENLAQKLSLRTIYKLDLDKDIFIKNCIEEINSILLYRKVKNQYEISKGAVGTQDSGKIVVGEGKTQVINS